MCDPDLSGKHSPWAPVRRWRVRCIFKIVLKASFLLDSLMQFGKVLRALVFSTAADGNNARRALDSAHAAAYAPIKVHPGLIFYHFDRIHRAYLGTGPAADAFVQLSFTNKIDGH